VINRELAQELLKRNITTDNLRSHCLAVASILEGMAVKLDQDKEKWFITGLLHDIDFELTKNTPEQHGIKAMDLLAGVDISEEMKNAIKSHTGNAPVITLLDKALWAADPLSGLLIATALMNPAKKISVVELNSLKKKYKNKAFAAGADREQIASVCILGITLDDFLQLSIDAMAKYETELGF